MHVGTIVRHLPGARRPDMLPFWQEVSTKLKKKLFYKLFKHLSFGLKRQIITLHSSKEKVNNKDDYPPFFFTSK